MIGMRLIIGALAGIWILFVQLLPVLLRFFKREEIGNAVLQAVIWLIVIYVLMLALHVVQIVLFFKKKKSFLLLYIVVTVIGIIPHFINRQQTAGLLAIGSIALEFIIIGYLLTAKNAAIYFGYYNRFNKTALNAFAVTETQKAMDELQNLAQQYQSGAIGQDFFEAKKRLLLSRL